MKLTRKWAMPNADTFSVGPIRDVISEYIRGDQKWCDPFARNSPFKHMCVTNDLNPEIQADYHLEALEFLRQFEDASFDGVLFDPPYSPRQIKEVYNDIGIKVTTFDTQSAWWSDRKNEAARILKPGGIAISFGWNSGGLGKKNDMEILQILLVPHGGYHNDTIVTVERKRPIDTIPILSFLSAPEES